jgi:hypothetical protein
MDMEYEDHVQLDIPGYLVPDPDDGETISSLIASTYNYTNVSRFCEISTADMMTLKEVMTSSSSLVGNSAFLKYALGTATGTCAFLTIMPTLEGTTQHVSVIHALCQHNVWPGIYAFIGNTKPPSLPTIKMEPNNGLDLYLRPTFKTYCNSNQVETFYLTHKEDILLPKEGETIRMKLPTLIYIPTVWVPAFTEPLLPNQARKRVIELCSMMPNSTQYLFEELLEWVTASCTEMASCSDINPYSGSSILTIPWRNVPIEKHILLWAETELLRMYPKKSQIDLTN